VNRALYKKDVSILIPNMLAEGMYARVYFVVENSEPLVCRLEDGVVFNTGLAMIMFYADPKVGLVNNIIDRVVEAGLYSYWISFRLNLIKLSSHKIAIVHPLDRYYSFNLYHMQPAFYLLLMGWFLSVICFMVQLLYNCVVNKRV